MSCKLNPNQVIFKRGLPKGYKHSKPSPRKGKTYEEIYGKKKAAQIKKKHYINGKKQTIFWHKMSDSQKNLFREKRSAEMKKRYANGWMPKAGRCAKLLVYNQFTQLEVRVDGTWEQLVANKLNEEKINWRRNISRFDYTNEHNIKSTYTPDFYLVESDTYVEVKGYETEKDRCKWRDFPHALKILRKQDVDNIKKGQLISEVLNIPAKDCEP